MRILYQCNGFLLSTIGGTEVLSHHLLKELTRRGHQILAVGPRADCDPLGPQTFDGLNQVKLDFDAAMASRRLPALRRISETVTELVRDFQPDILHLNDATMTTFFFRRGGDIASLPRVLTLHSVIRPAGRDGLQARLAAEADRIVAVSRAHADAAAAAMPSVQGKISSIQNTLPLPDLLPTDLPFAPPHLLGFGRLLTVKGFDLAIRVFASLRETWSEASLTIAGNGPEMSNLQDLARGLGVANQVKFTDWVMPDRVGALINTATAVLVPSRWPEPFGLVALQAAQMGRPTIASAVGGLPEIVEHGQTGLLVAPDDETALAEATKALLSDAPLARRMGAAARQRVQEKFDFSAFVDAYERVYAEAREAATLAMAV